MAGKYTKEEVAVALDKASVMTQVLTPNQRNYLLMVLMAKFLADKETDALVAVIAKVRLQTR